MLIMFSTAARTQILGQQKSADVQLLVYTVYRVYTVYIVYIVHSVHRVYTHAKCLQLRGGYSCIPYGSTA
jgi:hypothetical protein